ncbi:unnamed protein product [Urochloa humidicola]
MATLSPPPHPSSPPPLPSHLDATTLPTSPTPALTPSPAATSPPPHQASRSPQDTAAGRNKSQRWGRDTPPSGKSGGGGAYPPSFKAALLSTVAAAPPSPSSAQSENPPRIVPRILLRVADSRPSPAKRGPDAEGWQEAESKRSRKARRRAERGPRRRVPADLRGLCFNCFAPEHRAAACLNRTRCFRCRRPGHRASWCPNSGTSMRPAPPAQPSVASGLRKMAWRRKEVGPAAARGSDGTGGVAASIPPPAEGTVANGPPPVDACPPGGVAMDGGAAQEGGGRRRRRRVRRRRAAAITEDNAPPTAEVNLATETADVVVPRPRRIIDRSAKIARAEEELRCALLVLVVGDPMAVSVEGLAAELSRRYDLPAGSVEFHRLKPNELLLMFPTEADAVQVYDNERPIHLPQVTLHCRRWNRRQNASAFTLPDLVDIEVRGIPPHVWELETAEQLLDEWCWVRSLHSDTRERKDYSSFRLSAWCSRPEQVPAAMDLVVVEPPAPVEENPPIKRALSYQVNIAVKPHVERSLGSGVPPEPPQGGHGGRRRRRRESRSPDASSRSSAEGPLSRDDAPRSLDQGSHNQLGGGEAERARRVEDCSEPKDAAATTVAPRRVPHADMNVIDDMAALVILPSASRMGDAIPGILEDGMRYLDLQEAGSGQADPLPESDGLVLIGPAQETAPPVPHIPIDEPVLSALEISPAIQNIQRHQALSQVVSEARSSTLMANSRSGLCPLPTCAVEANGTPLPDLDPPGVEVASTLPPVVPWPATVANSDPTGVVEDDLEPQPAAPRPACVDAMIVPPPVEILVDHTVGVSSPAAAPPAGNLPSSVTWRPAEEVLPADFSTEPIVETTSREVSFVYSRKPRASVQQTLQPPASPPKTPPAASTFIKNVTKPLDITLPLPAMKQQRRHNLVGTEPPRRSRRIANLPPETHNPSATAVCRQLGFTDENSKVSAAMVDKYQVFFNSPLKRNDVKVMATMLHKELPEDFQGQSPGILVVA